MTDWVTVADIGTAAGTVVLAGATFVSVRASARSTRIAERALLAGQRPVLAPAGPDDPAESVQFADGRVFPVGNRQALAAHDAGVVYLAIRCATWGRAWQCCAATTSGANQRATSRTTRAAEPSTCGVIPRPSRGHSRRSSVTCSSVPGGRDSGRQPCEIPRHGCTGR